VFKNSGVFCLMPCTLVFAMWAMNASWPDFRSRPISLEAIQETRDANLARRYENRRIFLLCLEPTLEQLALGKLTMRQASESIIGYSRRYHPEFLQYLHWSEPGSTALERVARNCLRHFQMFTPDEPCPVDLSQVLPGLEKQLDEIVREQASRAKD
jgi:hypothetical protein